MFRKKDDYPMLTCVAGTYEQFAVFFQQLLSGFSWRHVAFIINSPTQASGKGRSTCEFTLLEGLLQRSFKTQSKCGSMCLHRFSDIVESPHFCTLEQQRIFARPLTAFAQNGTLQYRTIFPSLISI